MKMLTNRRTLKLVVLAALALGAVLLWSAQASAQPTTPPFALYGNGEPGDTITVFDEMGVELESTQVMSDGTWFMNVNCASEKLPTLSFQINGMPATVEAIPFGASQAEIILTLSGDAMPDEAMPDDSTSDEAMPDDAMADDDEMMEDDMTEDGDEMMEDDDSSMMQEDDDEMMDDETSDDEMMDNGYPESGTGGLADQSGPSTAALIGTVAILLTLLSALTIHRLRSNRA